MIKTPAQKVFMILSNSDKKIISRIFEQSNQITFPQTIDVRFTAKNNKTFYTNLTINKYFGCKTTEEFFIISVFDLTHHKMQTELIKESQLRFENITNSAPVMIWITGVNGLFIFVNNIWNEFTTRSIGEELGLCSS